MPLIPDDGNNGNSSNVVIHSTDEYVACTVKVQVINCNFEMHCQLLLTVLAGTTVIYSFLPHTV
jgi:hypothetical protein